MNTIVSRIGTWRPAPNRSLPSPYRPALGRQPFLGQARSGFFESPLVALVTDASAAGMSAYLAWGLGKAGNNWSTFFWVVTAAMTMKALHDMGRVK